MAEMEWSIYARSIRAVVANVLVRLIGRDDPAQVDSAEAFVVPSAIDKSMSRLNDTVLL